MNKTFLFCTFLFSVTATFSFGSDATIENEYIIRLQKDVSPQQINRSSGLVPLRQLSRRMNIWLFKSANASPLSRSAFQSMQQMEEIGTIQKNHKVSQRSSTLAPNDTRFTDQWSLNNTGQDGGSIDADIDAPEAWQISTGGITAAGDQVVIAIIDGGFDLNHQDLDYWKNSAEIPDNGIDDDGNGYVDDYDGWDAFGNDGKLPEQQHGTHVAGIAGAIGNNGIGISGVTWGAKIMPIAGASGNEAVVVAAYGYVLEMRALYNETDGQSGAFIVSTNASFGVDKGDPDNFPIWRDIYDSLGHYGIVSCAATANANFNVDVVGDMPTSCPSDFLITVTNTAGDDSKYSGAGYGATTIDLGAPGTSILSTVPGNSYKELSGTSMATPHLAGAVALLISAANAEWMSQYKADPSAGALHLKQLLLDGADPVASLQGITVTGGRLNVNNSIRLFVETGIKKKGNDAAISENRTNSPYYLTLSKNKIFIHFSNRLTTNVNVALFALTGQKVLTSSASSVLAGGVVEIDNRKISAGSYLLHITTDQGIYQRKILIKQ